VERYGVHFDPAVRDQVVARYRKLDLPAYWSGINAQLTASLGQDGKVMRVTLRYPQDAVDQFLVYGSMYNPGLKQPAGR